MRIYIIVYRHLYCFNTVDDVVIQMELATRSVSETGVTVEVCAQINSLPGELQTDLTVAFSASSSDRKAGLWC